MVECGRLIDIFRSIDGDTTPDEYLQHALREVIVRLSAAGGMGGPSTNGGGGASTTGQTGAASRIPNRSGDGIPRVTSPLPRFRTFVQAMERGARPDPTERPVPGNRCGFEAWVSGGYARGIPMVVQSGGGGFRPPRAHPGGCASGGVNPRGTSSNPGRCPRVGEDGAGRM